MSEPQDAGAAILAAPQGNGRPEPELRRLGLEDFLRAEPLVETKEVAIEGIGTVLVRGLTKAEQRWMRDSSRREDGTTDETKLELFMFHKGMADPAFSLDQAQAAFEKWDAARINTIIDAIIEASGLASEFIRKAVQSFREGP